MTQPSSKLKTLLDKGIGARPRTATVAADAGEIDVSLSDAAIDRYLARVAEVMSRKYNGVPHQGPTLLDHLVGDLELTTDTYTDGTTTEVFIRNPDDPTTYLGRGVARRRKGDPRDVEVGHTIGLARALRDMADLIETNPR